MTTSNRILVVLSLFAILATTSMSSQAQINPPRKACIPCQVFCPLDPASGARVSGSAASSACGDSSAWNDAQTALTKSLVSDALKYHISNLDETIRGISSQNLAIADHLFAFTKSLVAITDKRSGQIRFREEATSAAIQAKLNGVPGDQRMSLYRALPEGRYVESRYTSIRTSPTTIDLIFNAYVVDEALQVSRPYGPSIQLRLKKEGAAFSAGRAELGFDVDVEAYRVEAWGLL